MNPSTAKPRLALPPLRGWPLFIALSLLVHLLLLLLLYLFAPERLQLTDGATAPLAVQLVTGAPPPPAAVAPPPAAAQQPPAPTTVQQERAAQPAAAQAAPSQPPPARVVPERYDERNMGTSQRLLDTFPDAGGPLPAPAHTPPDDETRLQIESLIRTRFADHFIYPRMAQRHGWQGEVLLAFHIETDGTISHIQIVRGSGHAMLDEAALDSMRAIGHIEFTPGTTLHHMLELRMPVIYHLAQG